MFNTLYHLSFDFPHCYSSYSPISFYYSIVNEK